MEKTGSPNETDGRFPELAMFAKLKNLLKPGPPLPSSPALFEGCASETDARASAVLSMKGSEDATATRGSIALPSPPRAPHSDPRDYLPEETTEWVVSVSFDKPIRIAATRPGDQLARWRGIPPYEPVVTSAVLIKSGCAITSTPGGSLP